MISIGIVYITLLKIACILLNLNYISRQWLAALNVKWCTIISTKEPVVICDPIMVFHF